MPKSRKRKGALSDPESYIGKLLNCHLSKGLAQVMDWYIDSAYQANMPEEQFGGTQRRGTDAASLLVRSFMHWSNMRSVASMYFLTI